MRTDSERAAPHGGKATSRRRGPELGDELPGGRTALLVSVQGEARERRLVLAHVLASSVDAALSEPHSALRLGPRTAGGSVSHEVASFLRRRLTGSDPIPPQRRAMLAAAKAFIDVHLHDPELSPDDIAGGIYISKRYLHVLFQDADESVTRYVIARRLAEAHDRLSDRRHAHLSIRDMAARVGFKDPSHFARAFKSRYGVTPGRFRKSRLDGRAPLG
jgi:AraC-like DNA-binding protein